MSHATPIKSAPVIEYAEYAPEEADRHPTDWAAEAIAIETKNLSRAVVDKVLVRDITVQVQTGEVLAVVGPSGAGNRPSCGC